jgi:putative transposase
MHNTGFMDCDKHSLPRLEAEFYKAFAFIFWTHTTEGRTTGWLSDTSHRQFRELLLHASARHHLFCPVYTLMPDHLHLVWIGVHPNSDQKQATRFLRKHMTPLFHAAKLQRQPHDHVLREEDREHNAFQSTCYYIQENPVRKELVTTWTDYPYTGCMIPGYPELDIRASDYWVRFWRAYEYVRKQNDVM